jgi:hypothetical protein
MQDDAAFTAVGAAKNVEGRQTPTVSVRKQQANRNNAKKSTGPRTAQGKAHSRFNALKHGLCAKRILYSPNGKLADENLLKLLQALEDEYGSGNVLVELLLESILTEYWRHAQALSFEAKYSAKGGRHFFHEAGITNHLHRYITSSQRALLKNLQLLEKLQPRVPSVVPAETNTAPGSAEIPARGQTSSTGTKGQVIPMTSVRSRADASAEAAEVDTKPSNSARKQA